MAALLHDHPVHDRSGFPEPVARFFGMAAVAVAPAPGEIGPADPGPDRPALRVIPGGSEAARRVRRAPEVYRRRRVAAGAAALLLVVIVAGALAAVAVGAPSSAAPAVDTSSSPADPAARVGPAGSVGAGTGTPSGAAVYVVQPGDTLWAIAEVLDPEGDPRPLVDDLADLAGPGPLEAGTRLDLTALDR